MANFKFKYGHLTQSELMRPIQMLSELTDSSNKGSEDALKLKKEMLYMRLPYKAVTSGPRRKQLSTFARGSQSHSKC